MAAMALPACSGDDLGQLRFLLEDGENGKIYVPLDLMASLLCLASPLNQPRRGHFRGQARPARFWPESSSASSASSRTGRSASSSCLPNR